MSQLLTRLFAVRPGEENKTFLLYSLHFVFYLGQSWGALACLSLFLDHWDAADLSLMFIGDAFLFLAVGLIYSSFADRINNYRLLLIIALVNALWLISVQVLLRTNGGPGGLAYPYFYLGYDVFRDLTALHLLSYTAEYYDARSAKRALPFILSAGLAGNTVAGFSVPLFSRLIGLENVPLAWILCLVVTVGLAYLLRGHLPAAGEERVVQDKAAAQRGSLQNLSSGLQFVRESGMLRWLAVATFCMVLLMNLLIFRSSFVFKEWRQGDELFHFFGLFAGFSNIVGAMIQSLFLGRLVTSLGVGATNLFFPIITLASVGLMNFAPGLGFSAGLGAAVFARANYITLRKALHSPLDAMLYNGVPPQIRGRARAFVNGLIVPLGVLVGGLLVLAYRQQWVGEEILVVAGLAFALVYVAAMFKVRGEYGRSLSRLLTDEEFNIFSLGGDAFEQPDPATLALIQQRIEESQDDDMTVFLAEVFYELQDRAALPYLQEVARRRSPLVRAGIIQLLHEWPFDPIVRNLCLEGLHDEDEGVRRAAVAILRQTPNAAKDRALLTAFQPLIHDPAETIQAEVLPLLIASGDPTYAAPAAEALSRWLATEADSAHRALGLRTLAQTGDERLFDTLKQYLDDRSSSVRYQAIQLINDLITQSPSAAVRQLALETLRGQLKDRDESVRLAAVNGLKSLNMAEADQALMPALNDSSFEVRRQACNAMEASARHQLEEALAQEARYEGYLAESAAFVLAGMNHSRARRRAIEQMESLVAEVYLLHTQQFALERLDSPGAQLLKESLREEGSQLLDRVFWLLSALGSEQEAQNIRRSLQSTAATTRANAAETLEAITTPRLARLITPLFDGSSLPDLIKIAQDALDMTVPRPPELFYHLWPALQGQSDLLPRGDWLAATAIYTLIEAGSAAGQNGHGSVALERPAVEAALRAAAGLDAPHTSQVIRLGLARLTGPGFTGAEEQMLTVLEKVIFLKEVPFFQGMTINQLRILATISEEMTYEEGQQIFAEGEYGDTLYVVVSGSIAIQQQVKRRRTASITRLATLGSRDYFAEMAIFDNEAHPAEAVALKPTRLLLVRQAPLVALIKRQPDLGLDLLRVMSHRLREANAQIAEKTRPKTKELLDFYDKIDE
jgi:CRP-like cAMP-binding protein/HEAT repeat protein